MARRVFIETFGCQMNEVDSARMAALLGSISYEPAKTREEADLVLLNTCSIREKAAHKVYSALGALLGWKGRDRGRLIAVGGCLAQQEGDEIRRRAPHVDIVFGTHNIARIPELIRMAETKRKPPLLVDMSGDTTHWDVIPYAPEGASSAMVTIMQGCDNHCAYCIVPSVRGPEVSRPSANIIEEVRVLSERGVLEVVLLGQNVNSYGKKVGEIAFPELLKRISRIEGVRRIRFITSHPRDLDSETISLFGDLEELCPHIHLPLQSGSDRVLESMGRGYTKDSYLEKIDRLRRVRPGLAFSSDFIVGFPGETEEDFKETLEVMEAVRYDSCFSFAFSLRPGTRAAARADAQIDSAIAGERLSRLQTLQTYHTNERLKSMVGKTVPVLVEKRSTRDHRRLFGRTPCNKAVNFTPTDGNHGAMRRVAVECAGVHSLSGVEEGKGPC